jgi:hypothetical protein
MSAVLRSFVILPEPVRRGRSSSKSRSAELNLGLIDVVCGDFGMQTRL